MYTNAEDFQNAADILEQASQALGDGFSLTDYYTLSSRYLNAASRAATPEPRHS